MRTNDYCRTASAVLALCLVALLPGCRGKGAAASSAPAGVVLIVNGDDVGINADFTDATLKAYDRGAVDSMSLVANGSDADRAMALLKARPEIPVGLHYALVGDWKPLSPGASLRGPDGNMWATAGEAAAHVKTEEAVAEFEAQLKKLLDGGIDVKCVDSHVSGYFTRDDIYLAVFERARAHKIPIISVFYPGMSEDWRPLLSVASYRGIYALPGGEAENPKNRADEYWAVLSYLVPGTHYFFSHQGLGFADAAPTGDRLIRVDDSAFWTDPATKARIASLGIVRGSTATLRADFRKALKAGHGR